MSSPTPTIPDGDRQAPFPRERQWYQFEQAPGFICVQKGSDHVYEFANEAYRRLVGQRELIGRSVRHAMPDIHGQGFFERLDAVYATGQRFRADAVAVSIALTPGAMPETRFVDLVYEPVIDDDGKIIGVFTQGHDVTDAIHAKRKAKISDQRFKVFAQCMPSHVWISRADGHVEWFNDRTYAYTGYAAGTLEGDTWSETVHPDDRARAIAAWAHAVASENPYRIQFRIRRFDGVYRSFLMKADPVRNDRGDIEEWIGIDTDVDDEKRLGAQLFALNATLEQQVLDRTRELMTSEAALRQSQKMEAIGQLTGGVAHDFNNLLVPIIGSLDALIRRGIGTEREKRLIDAALQSADRAKILVERLLAFARRQPLQSTAVDLSALINGLTGLITSTGGPNIDVHINLSSDLPLVNADANQLEMAILNLGVNARDAMPDGGTLTIAAARERTTVTHRTGLEPGSYVLLSVADTGFGMDEATQARAAEPFFSTKGVGKGTGLGLSMVHGLVAQLGGALGIVSEPGRGTKVELWLPVSSDFAEVDVADASFASVPALSRGRVLLVDDEELVRSGTADMLHELGYEVIEANSAEQALQYLANGLIFSLVVTDHRMTGMSGVEMAQYIRSDHPSMPILLISGYISEEENVADLPQLSKPFRIAQLARCLAKLSLR